MLEHRKFNLVGLLAFVIPISAFAQFRAPCTTLSSSYSLSFSTSVASTSGDGSGLGTVLMDRMPGTGTGFGAQNNGGADASIGIAAGPSEGSDLFVSIGRVAGEYAFDVNGLSLAFGAQPTFLNSFNELNVGLFAANARKVDSKTATVDEFTVMVGSAATVHEPHSFVLTLGELLAVAVA